MFPSIVRKPSKRGVDLVTKGLMSHCVILKPGYMTKQAVAFYDKVHECT